MPPRRKRKAETLPDAETIRVPLSGGQACPEGQIDLWQTETLCDATVRVGTSEFKLHRAVLAASSGYMRGLLTSSMRDNGDVITLRDMEPQCFAACVAWMYRGACEADEQLLPSLLEAASRLLIPTLLGAICEALIARVNVESVHAYLDLSDRFTLPALEEAALREARTHFGSLVGCAGFCGLPVPALVALISSDALVVESEEVVFEAVVKWCAGAAPPPDASAVEELLSHVRFAMLSRAFLDERVEKEPLMLNHPRGGWLVAKALKQAVARSESAERPGLMPNWDELKVGDRVRMISCAQAVLATFDEVLPGYGRVTSVDKGDLAEEPKHLRALVGNIFEIQGFHRGCIEIETSDVNDENGEAMDSWCIPYTAFRQVSR